MGGKGINMCKRCGSKDREVCTVTDMDGDLYGECCAKCADDIHEMIELNRYAKVSECAEMLVHLQARNAVRV
jgi:hypothetical protein